MLLAVSPVARAAPPVALRQSAPLDWPEEDLSTRLMDGAHHFVEQQIAAAAESRGRFWKFDRTSGTAWEAALRENRERLREICGAVETRLPPRMERFGDDSSPALVAQARLYRVWQVRWSVHAGLSAEGLLVQPLAKATGHVVVVPDCNQTPEQLLGLAPGLPAERQFARRLAESGCELVIPVLVERKPLATTDEQIKRSGQTSREWLYRQAFHMGRHLIGYEVQKVLAAVDWLKERGTQGVPIGVAGYAEGGLIAFYAAAIDTRIDAALVSGYFGPRDRVWSEPIDRNVWSLQARFSDAEIAALIVPRHLVIEHAEIPTFASTKGDLATPEGESVRIEFGRIPAASGFPRPALITGPEDRPTGPFSEPAVQEFARRLSLKIPAALSTELPRDERRGFDAAERQQRTVEEIERHIQSLVETSDRVRDRSFLYAVLPELENQRWNTERTRPTLAAEKFSEAAKAFRRRFQEDAIGRFDVPYLPLNPRTRKVAETDKWIAWDVVLDVWPEVFAWGLLVVPKDLQPGERRPVVVCQHGRNGVPRDTLDRDVPAYNDFAAALAERGFITFAPHNLYRGEDRYRWLSRKANNVGATLFSFIVGQHEQILTWLASLPYVDGERIAFYGLSYGGETAVRVPPILEKYCLSICSGDFNQWTRKVAATEQPFSFMRTIEWEMPYWNLGHTFDYAEMAYLMIPRPFMVERGHLDRVGRDEWVAHEYAKVRFLYAQLGLADRTEIEFFQGGHSIHGGGTFAFLHKHLDWPPPQDRDR
jgi:dienelactone hydrolase